MFFNQYVDVGMTKIKCHCGEATWFMPKTQEDITGYVCKCGATFQELYEYWKNDYVTRFNAAQKEEADERLRQYKNLVADGTEDSEALILCFGGEDEEYISC